MQHHQCENIRILPPAWLQSRSTSFRRFHNGSLHILPFAGDGYNSPGSALDGGDGSRRKGEHAVRCRASNAYGRVVSRLVTIRPGERASDATVVLIDH